MQPFSTMRTREALNLRVKIKGRPPVFNRVYALWSDESIAAFNAIHLKVDHPIESRQHPVSSVFVAALMATSLFALALVAR